MNGMRVKLAELKAKVKEEKLKLHKKLSKEYHKLFKFMDVLVVVMILTNFLAVGMTNMLVMKQQPDKKLYEANPVQIAAGNYEQHEDVNYWNYLNTFIFNFFMWIVLIFCYIFYRRSIYTELQLTIMMVIVFYYFTIVGIDFFNDFGFMLGQLLYRG